jgi:molecular chaperone GrpE
MNAMTARVDFDSEQYYTLPIASADKEEGGRGVAPVSLFQLKSELTRLALYVEDLMCKEESAHNELTGSVSELMHALDSAKSEIARATTDETSKAFDAASESLASIETRLVARQDAVNARTQKLASDIEMLGAVLEGKIEGVRGVVAGSTARIAESVQEAILASSASMQADIAIEITDVGRLILKKMNEHAEGGVTAARTELSGDTLAKLENIEKMLRERSGKPALASAEALEKLERIEAAVASSAGEGFELGKTELRELLAVMDSFDRLMGFLSKSGVAVENSTFAGIIGIRTLLERFLARLGLERTETSGTFDPNVHRAMGVVSDTAHEDGAIIEVLLTGYTLKGRFVRSPEVVVNKLRR